MTILFWIFYSLLFVPVSYIFWIIVHEYSHVLMAKFTVGVQSYHIDWWPKIERKRILFALAVWLPYREATRGEQALIYNAPRYSDVIGMFFFLFSTFFCHNWFLFFPVAIISGGSIIDALTGISAFSESSDIKKACRGNKLAEFSYRVTYFLLSLLTVVVFYFLLSLRKCFS